MSYLTLDICGLSMLTGMPVGFYCVPQWTQYDNFRNVTLCKTLKTNADSLPESLRCMQGMDMLRERKKTRLKHVFNI